MYESAGIVWSWWGKGVCTIALLASRATRGYLCVCRAVVFHVVHSTFYSHSRADGKLSEQPMRAAEDVMTRCSAIDQRAPQPSSELMARLRPASRLAGRRARPPEAAAPLDERSGNRSGALPAAWARARARLSARAGASEASSQDVAGDVRNSARVQAAQRAAAARTATPSRHGRSVCFVLCCLRLVSGTRWSVQQQSPHGSGVVLRCTFVWVHRHGHGVQPRAVSL